MASGRGRISETTQAIDAQNRAWSALAATISDSLSTAHGSLDQASDAVTQYGATWDRIAATIAESVATIEVAAPSEILPADISTSIPDQLSEVLDTLTATTDAVTAQSLAWSTLSESATTAAGQTSEIATALARVASGSSDASAAINSMAGTASAGMEQTSQKVSDVITTIQIQEQSWSSLAATSLSALAHVTGPVISLIAAQRKLAAATLAAATANAIATPPTLTLAAAVNFLLSPIVLVAAAVAAVGAALYYLTSSEEDATDATNANANASSNAADSYSLWNDATTRLGLSQEKLSGELSAVEVQKQSLSGSWFDESTISSLGKLVTGAGEVSAAYQNLKATLVQPFIDAASAVSSCAISLLHIKEGADTAASMLKLLADGIDYVTDQSKRGIQTLEAYFYRLSTGATAEDAEKFIKQGEAISETAARTQQAIATMEAISAATGKFAKAQEQATSQAAHNAETQRIGTIATIAGINEEERALQTKAGTEIRAGVAALNAMRARGASADEIAAQEAKNNEAQKRNAQLAEAIANQRQKVESGSFVSPVASAINAARQSLLALTDGQDAAAIAALKAKGATDEEVAALEELQRQTIAANAAKEAKKNADAEAKRITDDATAAEKRAADQLVDLRDKLDIAAGAATEAEVALRQMARQGFGDKAALDIAAANAELEKLDKHKSGNEKITDLKDKIDVLTGAATDAEIAMRELSRQGFSQEQIEEIGALTAEVDRLQDANKKTPKQKSEKSNAAAAFVGSKEAAEIMLRGVGGGNKMENLANAQLVEQKKIAAALVANKPAPAAAKSEKVSGVSKRVETALRGGQESGSLEKIASLTEKQLAQAILTTDAIKAIKVPALEVATV